MILLPIGHEETTCKRLPWVTFAIMIACVVAFFASGRQNLNPREDSRSARHAERALEYYFQHPYLELDAEFRELAFSGGGEEAVDDLFEETGDLYQPPTNSLVLDEEQAALDELTQTALNSLDDHPLRRFGLVPGKIEPIGFVTHMFLHTGWMHLIGNLLILFLCGPFVEDAWGRPLYLGFYLTSGVFAALAHIGSNADSLVPMVGASGAIAGVMGAFLVRYRLTRIKFFYMVGLLVRGTFSAPAWLMLPLWFGEQLFMGMLQGESSGGGVAYWAHVGGFVAGAGIALGLASFRIEERFIQPQIDGKISIDNSAVETALAAQAAGEGPAALQQLMRIAGADRANHDASVALWGVAVEQNRMAEAAPIVLEHIAHQLRAGHPELALDQWGELIARLPQVQAPPALLLHLAHESLRREMRQGATIALRLAMLSAGGQQGGGLALRIARMAQGWDRETAIIALKVALNRQDLEPRVRADAAEMMSRLHAPVQPLQPV